MILLAIPRTRLKSRLVSALIARRTRPDARGDRTGNAIGQRVDPVYSQVQGRRDFRHRPGEEALNPTDHALDRIPNSGLDRAQDVGLTHDGVDHGLGELAAQARHETAGSAEDALDGIADALLHGCVRARERGHDTTEATLDQTLDAGAEAFDPLGRFADGSTQGADDAASGAANQPRDRRDEPTENGLGRVEDRVQKAATRWSTGRLLYFVRRAVNLRGGRFQSFGGRCLGRLEVRHGWRCGGRLARGRRGGNCAVDDAGRTVGLEQPLHRGIPVLSLQAADDMGTHGRIRAGQKRADMGGRQCRVKLGSVFFGLTRSIVRGRLDRAYRRGSLRPDLSSRADQRSAHPPYSVGSV